MTDPDFDSFQQWQAQQASDDALIAAYGPGSAQLRSNLYATPDWFEQPFEIATQAEFRQIWFALASLESRIRKLEGRPATASPEESEGGGS